MCGFVGQYGPDLRTESFLRKVLSISNHRGPDQSGVWRDGYVQLGFNRLAIQDLTNAGDQPMISPANRYVLVFNGEIYNHLKLRKKLPGYSYRSHSDTETIAHALDSWGVNKTVEALEGMFALVAYNLEDHSLNMTRDFAGIKPLFYGQNQGSTWFASQFDQVVRGISKSNLDLRKEGMRDFLQLGYMQAPVTIYKQIYQVEPGQIIKISDGIIQKRFFHRWGAPENTELKEYRVDNFLSLFGAEIKDQLIGDVPIASFFSSGIDSTLVTAKAREMSPDITAFTVGVSDAEINEADRAKKYAHHLDLNHVIGDFSSNDVLSINDDHFKKLGEPFADYSSLPTYMICKKGKGKATVMLSGDGGDELFWGYPRWNKFLKYYGLFKYPKLTRRAYLKFRRAGGESLSHGPSLFKNLDEWVLNGQSHNAHTLVDKLMPEVTLSAELRELYCFDGQSFEDFRAWLRWNEFYGHLQRVLTKVDRMSMAHSLEVRVPFLSKRIIDFAWSQSTSYGKQHFENKVFLKQALKTYLPESLIQNKKLGFSIPLDSWLRNQLREETLDLLNKDSVYGEEFLDRSVWTEKVNDFYKSHGEGDWGIWIMYAWQKWGELLEVI
ncbi:asparagine synthase (glutamine-hydrolyzing) [Roseivirga sp. E12]|uniref:asparagine synthase (glutamine-hydrolyzing) n=1 Tax=Roseivirga sp. E12 TaxID=2819237 RepID=UPI001ABCC2A8|nr:asparagine synthase (glutamine-hydrolyzing) [Roseivirga sp. E12]MBO3699084.1 asparagine synthase (glutamine-hydrolyzing) [Roseivirga sp. E12]